MTREEAIKILSDLAGYEKTMDLIKNHSVSVQDALFRAIKALEQEPSGDNEAWECARKISAMTMDECEKVFGEYRYLATILQNFTASEAIAKIKAYEEG